MNNIPPPFAARRRFLSNMVIATAGVPAATSSVIAWANNGATEEITSAGCVRNDAPMKELEGKVAFVTGGSSGIGLGIVRAFADAGMKVVVGYRTKKHLDEAMRLLGSAGNRIHPIDVDVADRSGMERAADETIRVFGKVHVLVNNAGVVHHAPLSSTTYDDWDWQINVNLNGVFNGVRAFLPRIQSHGEGGQIVATSSILGLFTTANSTAYSASKYAVVGMMESLRAELFNSNIGVSVFCPGLVASGIQDASRNRPRDLGDTLFKPDLQAQEREKELRRDPELAMDPSEAGQRVLRGVRNNDLYILTHPEFEQVMQDRHDALMASVPRDAHPTEARWSMARSGFKNSVYAAERNRRRCAAISSRK